MASPGQANKSHILATESSSGFTSKTPVLFGFVIFLFFLSLVCFNSWSSEDLSFSHFSDKTEITATKNYDHVFIYFPSFHYSLKPQSSRVLLFISNAQTVVFSFSFFLSFLTTHKILQFRGDSPAGDTFNYLLKTMKNLTFLFDKRKNVISKQTYATFRQTSANKFYFLCTSKTIFFLFWNKEENTGKFLVPKKRR